MDTDKIGFLQAAQAAKIFSIHKNTWFKWRKKGLISAGVRLGYNRVGWPIEEVNALYERVKSGEIKL